jgi:hypothetical protein
MTVARVTTARASFRLVAVGLALLAAAACGTTVQNPPVAQGVSSELGAPVLPVPSDIASAPGPVRSRSATPAAPGSSTRPTVAGPISSQLPSKRPTRAASPRGPIKVGFLATDFSSVGASFGFTGPAPDIMRPFKDLVAYLNKHGGLAGRQIKGDYQTLSFTSPDATTAFHAACTHFIEDQHDELIVTAGEFGPTFEACLAKAHVVHFDASMYGQDLKGQQESPYYLGPVTFGLDRYTAALIKTAVTKRWVAAGQTVGVVLQECPEQLRTYNNVWVPLAKQYRLRLVTSPVVCNSSGNVSQGVSQIQSAVLKLHGNGAKAVSFLSAGDAFIAALFSLTAQTQAWHPRYLMTSLSEPARLSIPSALGMPEAQLRQVLGIGWVPMVDIGSHPPINAKQRAQQELCHRISPNYGGAVGLNPSARIDGISQFFMECDTMLIVQRILEANGGDLSLDGILSVYPKVVSSFVAASNRSGTLRVTGRRTDGAFAAAPFGYFLDCSCVRYTGPPRSFD